MSGSQQLLFPDPKPLVERFGREFFRQLPEHPGVYLMRDAGDAVLYVGKAKNLKKRLGSYRVANPDRMPRRLLRLLRAVVRIELRACATETAALSHEAELLRTLRPKFNRVGTWSAPPRFLSFDREGETLFVRIVESPAATWRCLGPLRGPNLLRMALLRLLWLVVYPQRGLVNIPAGWVRGRLDEEMTIHLGAHSASLLLALDRLLSGDGESFCDWIKSAVTAEGGHPFEKQFWEADLDFVNKAFLRMRRGGAFSSSGVALEESPGPASPAE